VQYGVRLLFHGPGSALPAGSLLTWSAHWSGLLFGFGRQLFENARTTPDTVSELFRRIRERASNVPELVEESLSSNCCIGYARDLAREAACQAVMPRVQIRRQRLEDLPDVISQHELTTAPLVLKLELLGLRRGQSLSLTARRIASTVRQEVKQLCLRRLSLQALVVPGLDRLSADPACICCFFRRHVWLSNG
jgi:hypothetical protein